jgi:iduronate 2-sulfatase
MPIAKALFVHLLGQVFMRGRYFGKNEITWGEHFQNHNFSSTRVGKIFHMRVPGDIIPGTDGQDVPECWSEKYNSSGLEAHTPGNYACLNLNKFTTDLEGRESTRMPNRMFVTVDYEGDGSDQPDWKTASKSIEMLRKFKKQKQPFFLATGFIRPHYP